MQFFYFYEKTDFLLDRRENNIEMEGNMRRKYDLMFKRKINKEKAL